MRSQVENLVFVFKGLKMSEQEKPLSGIVNDAINLYKYLQHLVKLRTAIVTDISSYKDVIWLADIPHESRYCYCSAWEIEREESDHIWIDIKRPNLPKVPSLPDECREWIDLVALEDYEKVPALKERIPKPLSDANNPNESIGYLELALQPDVEGAWDEYLEKKWKPWAEVYAPLKKVQDIYSRLFSMYQQQKALGESYEVVIGIGILSYKTKLGASIYRQILTAQTELIFEPNRGAISVKASPGGANLQFETEMLDFDDQPAVEIQRNLENEAKEMSNDIWDKTRIHSLVKSWVNSFNSKSRYNEVISPPLKSDISEIPEVNLAPALILRERTKVGILKFISKIIDNLKNDDSNSVPLSVKLLVTSDIESVEQGNALVQENQGHAIDIAPEEIFFPLQYNDEQLRIIKHIYNSKGVLVQGPPGTGKSHTIANIVCHLLAEGKRVLVTSQTARALKVLNEKIPAKIRPLCVSVLGNRQEDLDNLISAVHEITSMNNIWDKEENQKRIKRLEQKLSDLKKKFQEVRISLTELREKETYKHSIINGKFNGTAQEIGRKIRENENRYGWIPDEISSEDLPPITQDEFKGLVYAHRKFNRNYQNELLQKRIKHDELIPSEKFIEIVEKEQKYKNLENEIKNNIQLRLLYDKLKNTDSSKRKRLLDSLNALEKVKADACRRPLPWLKNAVFLILGDQDRPLKDLASVTKMHLENLRGMAIEADRVVFSLPKNIDLQNIKADSEDLLDYLKKHKHLGWWVFRPPIYSRIKYLLFDVRVGGRCCDNVHCLNSLINYIDVQTKLSKLKDVWKDKIQIPEGTFFSQVALISEQLEALEVVLAIESHLLEAKKDAGEIEIISEPIWHDDKEIEKLITVLEGTLVIDGMREIEERIEKMTISLRVLSTNSEAHPLVKELLNSLESRDWNSWNKAYEKSVMLDKDQVLLNTTLNLLNRLKSKATLLADLVTENPFDDIIEKCSDDFEEAWDWLRADAWLREFEAKHDEYQLQRDYEDIDKSIKTTLAELASEKAWYGCLSTMTETQRKNLMAWSHTIKKIGKGTGKHAEKYRREAEEYMAICRGAIPAWIMPLYRVVESIKPEKEIFDVVIVDESSQSGPEALSLFYIAKKCIIVGDDQQISPEDVGADHKAVDSLVELYLKDIPLRKTYGLQSSLFTHAQIRYKSRIVLREHFRCVPEIIQFSNNLCYEPLGASLIPLRSCPPKRLDPIQTVYVKDGYKEGLGQRVVNIPEAQVLVEYVAKCCASQEYKNKSMGIIILQGHAQDGIIERMLIEKIGAEEIEKRNIICGDPYDFQGDERDIIFLSLVAAPNDRPGPLAKETDKRRFNVAFSRARDQIWLFHSATLSDLSPTDYRYKLLSYCLNPMDTQHEIAEEECESQFEKDVYKKITEKGYKVMPQFKVAEYRIDLVVEGGNKRLAVECDGDDWHGPEEYDRDQWRQRILERAGWRFWRIRGSLFYRDPEQALDSLWQILDEMGIHVIGHKEGYSEVTSKAPEIVTNVKPLEAIEVSNEGIEEDRLSAAIEYSNRKEAMLYSEKHREIQKAVTVLLEESSQGKDLIADKVLRKLGYSCRGRNRDKLRRRVLRVVTDMRRQGLIEDYETNKRIRMKLAPTKERTLFE